MIYINLFDLWDDDRDDPDDLVYSASSSTSWIDIKYGPAEWGDIKDGPKEDDVTDDLNWSDTGRTVGTDPGDNDDVWVMVVEIDRTKRNNQDDRGSFTLTARDDDGASTTVTVPVIPGDENLDIADGAIRLSGSAREDSTLRVSFNDNLDPDLAGSAEPALVLYTWYSADSNPDTGQGENEQVLAVSTSPDPLRLTQAHVNKYIRVDVTYYEEINGQINSDEAGGISGQLVRGEWTSRDVTNTPDDGVGHFTITVGSDALTASVVIRDEDVTGTDLTTPAYKWEVSANGVGGWGDAPGDNDSATYNLPDGEGRYFRVVATYDADGIDDLDNDEEEMDSVYSDPIRIGDVASADAPRAALSPTGSAFPGGTLSVSGPGVSSVQWQRDIAPGLAVEWADIPGATGDLNITDAHAGSTVRAVVTYESTNPNQPGVTAVVIAVDGNDLDSDGNTTENGITIRGTSSTTPRPSAVDDHEITGHVMGSGHARREVNNRDQGDNEGQTVSITGTVPLASLFQDPDTPAHRLSFTADGATGPDDGTGKGLQTNVTISGGSYISRDEKGILVLELDSGKLTYVSDQLRGHDGDDGDGEGNVLRLTITANDSPTGAESGDSANTANVDVRINVAPTGISFTQGDNGSGNLTGIVSGYTDGLMDDPLSTGGDLLQTPDTTQIVGITLNELVAPATGREILATIDVQDENFVLNAFGTHEVTVVGDDRFVITNSGGNAPGYRDTDGSTWQLRLAPGATFDHETQADANGNPADGKQIWLTFAATDGGGLSTPTPNPSAGYVPIRLVVTIQDNGDDNPKRPENDDTPGLKDNEGSPDTPDDDDTLDSADDVEDDPDTDGGTPPPPGTSIGLIEDFVGNVDGFEQDILEDFMLVIDDGIDIA